MTEFVIFPAVVGSAGPPQAATAKRAEREPSGESPFAAVLEKARKKEPDEAELALAAQTVQPVQPAPSEQLSNSAEAPEQAAGDPASAESVQDVQGAGSQPAKGCGSSGLETAASSSAAPGAAGGQSASSAGSQPAAGLVRQPAAADSLQPAGAAQTAAGSQPDTVASQAGLEGQAATQLLKDVQAETSGEAQAPAGQMQEPAQGASGEITEPVQEAAAGTVSAQASPAPAGEPKSVKPKRTAAGMPASAADGQVPVDGDAKTNVQQTASVAIAQSKGNERKPAVQARQAASNDRQAQEEVASGLKNTGSGLETPEMGYTSLQQTQTIEKSFVEPARLAEARSPQLVHQLSDGIQNLDKSGQTTLRLQLFPENLGKVDLRLTSGAGGLHVTLTADQPLTGTLLERHLPELVQALADAGVNLAGLEINYGNSGQDPQEAWRWQPSKGMRFASQEPDQPLEAGAVYKPPSTSGVDYRV